MIIISAGVVMNLIFAVIFATIAYDMGVSYVPCVISGTATGNPAWVAGWEPGDQILQLRRDGAPDEHLRFEKDLMVGVILNGANREMELLVRQEGTGEERWYTVVPSGRRIGPHKRATLGVFGPRTARLDATMPVVSLAGQEDLSKKFVGGEEILAVDGEPLPRDERTGQVLGHHVDAYLADRMDQTLTLTVSRPLPSDSAGASASGETLEIAVPPTRLRMTGLVMQAGPIAAVRTGSPADEAGIKEGDRLLRLAGEDIGDPLTLAQRMLDHIGEEIEIQVERAGQPRSFQVRPVPPKMYDDNVGPGTLVGLESLGIALPVDSIVLDVQPGSPGEKAKIQPGDRIVSIQFLSDGEKDGDPVVMSEVDADQRLVSVPNWCYAHHAVQQSESFTLEVVVHRPSSPPSNDGGQPQAIPLDGELETLAPMLLEPELSEQWFYPQRGIRLEQLTEIRTAGSIGESLSLGWRETKSSLIQVVLVLQRLFTGQISVRSMGGPLTIAAAAGTEASKGLPRLLIFLTFLSANLAVLNFLPIPALDGGHMVFLAAEGIRGKPVNERVQITLTLVGVACLLSLMLLVFTNDLQFLFFR
jgi:regulator of sigma E protease